MAPVTEKPTQVNPLELLREAEALGRGVKGDAAEFVHVLEEREKLPADRYAMPQSSSQELG